MKAEAIKATLLTITPGYTRAAWNSVVTRWSDDEFEVGTVGRERLHIDDAVERVLAAVARGNAPLDEGAIPTPMEGSTMTTKTKELELSIAIEEYIGHLKAIGKKASTVGTATRTMSLFEEHLGAKKVVAKIMPVHVAGFFNSETATTLKGKPRAKASILQIRRIVRSALVWWHEQGYLASVPLPKDEKKFLEPGKASKTTDEQPTAAAESK